MTITERFLAAALGLLLGAQAIGKLLDVQLYVVALDRFRAMPTSVTPAIAVVWILVELTALMALGTASARPMRAMRSSSAPWPRSSTLSRTQRSRSARVCAASDPIRDAVSVK